MYLLQYLGYIKIFAITVEWLPTTAAEYIDDIPPVTRGYPGYHTKYTRPAGLDSRINIELDRTTNSQYVAIMI